MDPFKIAHAKRIADDLYNVTFPGSGAAAANVPLDQLKKLAESGYRVEIDQTLHRTATEPPHYVLALRGPLAEGTTITDGTDGPSIA